MKAVLIAQFLSALADNALLFIVIGMLKQSAVPEWTNPLLQQVFLISYIVLAPFVGAFADRMPKGRVMFYSNGLKLIAVILLLFGLNPFICYAFVGIGACMYSPAKYGILKELKGEEFLVKANAMMEGSTIAAILIGVIGGGFLADYAVKEGSFSTVIIAVIIVYFIASISNLFIPKTKSMKLNEQKFTPIYLIKLFIKDFKIMFSDFQSRVALFGTGLFFGVGATMRFLIIAWVPVALNIDDNKTSAILNAVVAVGIVIGSVIAGRIPVGSIRKVLSAGILMGVSIILLSISTNIIVIYMLLILIGTFGGIFLIPLNALLQKQGHRLVGGGHAVAIQNFTENTIMLVMLAFYMGMLKTDISIISISVIFGSIIVVLMTWLRIYSSKEIF